MASENSPTLPQGLMDSFPRVVCKARFSGKEQEAKELHYFCLQGLGELPRLLLEVSETPYDSVMYFGNGEYKEFATFGQLPVYKGSELGDLVLAQSSAICHHIARETGLDGSDVSARALQDMLWELGKDISGKKEVIYVEGPLDSKFEGLLVGAAKVMQKSGGPYISGSKIGYGDIGMFHALHTIEGLKPGFLKPWTDLQDFVTSVASIPAIEKYLCSPRRLPLTENELGKGHKGPVGYKYVSPLNPMTVAEVYDK